jgi:hypothetical protein
MSWPKDLPEEMLAKLLAWIADGGQVGVWPFRDSRQN